MVNVLVVDDDELMLKAICHAIAADNLRIHAFSDPKAALASFSRHQYDIVLSDQHMPGMEGLTLLEQVREINPGGMRLLISAYREFDSVIRAFNDGLLHRFLIKPWHETTLRRIFETCLGELSAAPAIGSTSPETDVVPPTCSPLTDFHGMLSLDVDMLNLFGFVARTARSGGPFHVSGETGTGKELLARAIHLEQHGPGKPFVAVNCANLSETMLESQLFGHRKGAFTGAITDQQGYLDAANGGTLFLDEVTELPLGLQAKLLRVLQEREYVRLGDTVPRHIDLCVISAGQVPLSQAVASGIFRADLKYRLEVLPVRIPPLRKRRTDIVPLFDDFLRKACTRLHRRQDIACSADTRKILGDYDWPGNVRELNNVATYVCAIMDASSREVTPALLPPEITQKSATTARTSVDVDTATRQLGMEDIQSALAAHGNNKSAAARALGVSRMTLWRHLRNE